MTEETAKRVSEVAHDAVFKRGTPCEAADSLRDFGDSVNCIVKSLSNEAFVFLDEHPDVGMVQLCSSLFDAVSVNLATNTLANVIYLATIVQVMNS